MIHIVVHVAAPVLLALAFYRPQWRGVALILIATMIVDIDHLLADPIYDPERCSIGFHPLHTGPAITLYLVLGVLPLVLRPKMGNRSRHRMGASLRRTLGALDRARLADPHGGRLGRLLVYEIRGADLSVGLPLMRDEALLDGSATIS